jgi:hypothetical protein
MITRHRKLITTQQYNKHGYLKYPQESRSGTLKLSESYMILLLFVHLRIIFYEYILQSLRAFFQRVSNINHKTIFHV